MNNDSSEAIRRTRPALDTQSTTPNDGPRPFAAERPQGLMGLNNIGEMPIAELSMPPPLGQTVAIVRNIVTPPQPPVTLSAISGMDGGLSNFYELDWFFDGGSFGNLIVPPPQSLQQDQHQQQHQPPQPQTAFMPTPPDSAYRNSFSSVEGEPFIKPEDTSIPFSRLPYAAAPNPSPISSQSSNDSRGLGWIPQRPSEQPRPSTAVFSTDIDKLMRAIQSKEGQSDGAQEKNRSKQAIPGIKSSPSSSSSSRPRASKKRYVCKQPGCDRAFHQKTHLEIHNRAHTGQKPFVCSALGCGQRFSQLGNLRTHERRHTGERPYACDICGKRFAQHGNVRAHQIVHNRAKAFVCKLDNCGKRFTQLGNLKSHQNKFHSETLRYLHNLFASADTAPSDPWEKEMWEYFGNLYKNCNKGIKGRGKDRKISTTTTMIPPPALAERVTTVSAPTVPTAAPFALSTPSVSSSVAAVHTGSNAADFGGFRPSSSTASEAVDNDFMRREFSWYPPQYAPYPSNNRQERDKIRNDSMFPGAVDGLPSSFSSAPFTAMPPPQQLLQQQQQQQQQQQEQGPQQIHYQQQQQYPFQQTQFQEPLFRGTQPLRPSTPRPPADGMDETHGGSWS